MSAGGEAGGRDACSERYENFMAPAETPDRSAAADRPATVSNAASGSQFLTVAEVASLMRVSKMTVYRLVHSGELPAVRVGRSFRVHAKAVHDYLETSYFDAG